VDLIIHPVRLRILQALGTGPQTTREIAKQLPSVPQSTLYRHLKLLLEGELIGVCETRLVQGIQEKVYELRQPPHLDAEALKGRSAEDHMDYFTTFVLTLLQSFDDFVSGSDSLDAAEIPFGYSTVGFWASDEELVLLQKQINETLGPLLRNPSSTSRRRFELSLILHPTST
jgi:DNA-binding transcriptional ArsR family regulator